MGLYFSPSETLQPDWVLFHRAQLHGGNRFILRHMGWYHDFDGPQAALPEFHADYFLRS